QAGTLAAADNVDGSTFRIFDVRGEFPRFWDDGRGVDGSRAFGTWEAQEVQSHQHSIGIGTSEGDNPNTSTNGNGRSTQMNTDASGGSETRPRNTAFTGIIKF